MEDEASEAEYYDGDDDHPTSSEEANDPLHQTVAGERSRTGARVAVVLVLLYINSNTRHRHTNTHANNLQERLPSIVYLQRTKHQRIPLEQCPPKPTNNIETVRLTIIINTIHR